MAPLGSKAATAQRKAPSAGLRRPTQENCHQQDQRPEGKPADHQGYAKGHAVGQQYLASGGVKKRELRLPGTRHAPYPGTPRVSSITLRGSGIPLGMGVGSGRKLNPLEQPGSSPH